MSNKRYPEEFRIEAAKQITERGYLAVVFDLFSRQVIGWSMQSQMGTELALNALLMAV